MDIAKHFAGQSKYINASMVTGPTRVIMRAVVIEDMPARSGGTESLPVLFFKNAKRGLVLKPTVSQPIIDHYGDETDEWTGKVIILYPAQTQAFGEQRACVRVRIPKDPAPATKTTAAAGNGQGDQAAQDTRPAPSDSPAGGAELAQDYDEANEPPF
jgi:hypothetical protein